MTSKRISAVLMLAFIFGTFIATMYNAWKHETQFPKYNRFYYMREYMGDVEDFIKTSFPFHEELKSGAVKLQMLGGEQEFDQIFIGDDILVESLGNVDSEILHHNLQAVEEFTRIESNTPVHVMYLPTKYAIKQKELPENAELFALNQKSFIEKAYAQLQGKATTVNVYPVLFANSDKYLYYRTDPNLTALGAYYVYSVLAQRLSVSVIEQEDFSQEHILHDFYGSTYQESPYKKITPDVVTLYHPQNSFSHTVTHFNDYEYTYNELYPRHLLDLDAGLNVLLGGDSGDITIRTNLRREKSLLVFGDRTFLPVLPLLTSNYTKIRFIDFEYWNSNRMKTIDVEQYDQVLLAYSVETMVHKPYPSGLREVCAWHKSQH